MTLRDDRTHSRTGQHHDHRADSGRDIVIRRFKTGHASALENRPLERGVLGGRIHFFGPTTKGLSSVRSVCAGLLVSHGTTTA